MIINAEQVGIRKEGEGSGQSEVSIPVLVMTD
jgi:hypothetical protein